MSPRKQSLCSQQSEFGDCSLHEKKKEKKKLKQKGNFTK